MPNTSDYSSIRCYMREIRKYAALSEAEEIELSERIRQGSKTALVKLVQANLRFVVSVAFRYRSLGLSLQDIISEGNLGLIKAAQKFDGSRGFRFITYAVWWIRQSIMAALEEQCRIVHMPINRIIDLQKLERTMEALEKQFGRTLSLEEIAQNTAMTVDDVVKVLKTSIQHVSLDTPCAEDECTKLLDKLQSDADASPDLFLHEEALRDEIDSLVSALQTREAEVIRLYYGLHGNTPQTLQQIGARLHLTGERVRQIKERALQRLRQRWFCEHKDQNLMYPAAA
jgi:RNA polymerase primary sigma factor